MHKTKKLLVLLKVRPVMANATAACKREAYFFSAVVEKNILKSLLR